MFLLFCRPYGAMGSLLPPIHRGSASLHRLPVIFTPLRGYGFIIAAYSQGLRCAPPPACGHYAPDGAGDWCGCFVRSFSPPANSQGLQCPSVRRGSATLHRLSVVVMPLTGLGFVISVLPMSVANRSDFDYIDDRHLSGKMWFRDI